MSCFCSAIELNNDNSCFHGNSNINNCVRSGYERIMSMSCSTALTAGSSLPKTASSPVWKMLWTKMKREKRRLFDCSSTASAAHVVPYDPHSYSQNFDQGSMADPDNLSRSFSARFAVPSRVFQDSSAGLVA